MNILSVVSYCSNACKNDCHLPQSPWNDFIDWLPCIILIALLSIIVMFIIKYGVEYNRINKDYLLKTEKETTNKLMNIENNLNDALSKIEEVKDKLNDFKPLEEAFREDIQRLKKIIDKKKKKKNK